MQNLWLNESNNLTIMEIIRDEQMPEIFIIPALQRFGITRCNVEGCHNRPSTILTDVDGNEGLNAGICEIHYQQAKKAGKWAYKLNFHAIAPELPLD